MARTTATGVKQILDNCSLDDAIVNAYITAANLVVTEVFENNSEHSNTMLIEIEKWFTAHMIASTRWRTVESETVGDASVKYTGKYGLGLDFTPYGQMVQQLDTENLMSSLGKKGASIYAVKSFE